MSKMTSFFVLINKGILTAPWPENATRWVQRVLCAARSSGGICNPSDEPVAPRAHHLGHCSCAHTETGQLIIPGTLRQIPRVWAGRFGKLGMLPHWCSRCQAWGWSRQGLKCPCHEDKGWDGEALPALQAWRKCSLLVPPAQLFPLGK